MKKIEVVLKWEMENHVKKVICRRLVSIQRPPRYERITNPNSDHCGSR
jgi:hypothetical protein